ncbi:PLP-dependent aminotransferase family protein [Paenibacillus sp. J5C_2022]|uniref:aminotransferase-like domain-containing protein n=1 Tax=Paenibacillus sp. J5C2022 TaxID=2977129 RepID=UPI0021D172A3|nr:PLP-dependent aminotransferase family protein [Paenibacillus sp. J5C2022]MCU6707242.1 PLP-dependent aminotransferase family protein [Paenibacillus sp. J5C2022]
MLHILADRMEGMKASEIRELLKLTEQPGMISFAGGLPDSALFPLAEIAKARDAVLSQQAKEALQYSVTEGYAPLRDWIADRMNRKHGTAMDREHVLITNGSQQGLDLSGKLFLNKGDVVLCESPTYLGALNALRAYEPRFVEAGCDEEGMLIEQLRKQLETHPVKMIYVIPNFQNPTGRSWSAERRKQFMACAAEYDAVIIEDDPYGELWFRPAERPSLLSMDARGQVIHLGSFSKVYCPGYRIGWLTASTLWMEKYVLAKQSSDLHSSSISQREIHAYLTNNDLDRHIDKLRDVYRKRRDAMLQAMRQHLPEEARYHEPSGGLFIWVELPEGANARALLKECLNRGVAFVPGEAFFPAGGHENTLRLNYSVSSESDIWTGIERLGAALRQYECAVR